MAGSKKRPLWSGLPAGLRQRIEDLVGGAVTDAESCAGGFSPGFASRLTLAGGRRVFVKAMDGEAWPADAEHHRAEAAVAAGLPARVPTAALLGFFDDGRWTVLAFEHIDGAEPLRPWTADQLSRVVAATAALSLAVTPAPIPLSRDHPRLGGWGEIAGDPARVRRLRDVSSWASDHLDRLTATEPAGLAAARGDALVHFDLYPHNILLTRDRVVFVDWPHARLGAPVIDLVTLLSSAAADGIDPEPYLVGNFPSEDLDAILTAHAGFLLAGGLAPMPPGLEAIAAEKLRLGLGAIHWLRRRSTRA
jgi:hypothetical protein